MLAAPTDTMNLLMLRRPVRRGVLKDAMALHWWPALPGLQRSFRRIFQLFSWALARSPGPRSLAWERLACFCDAGLSLPLYGVATGTSAP